MTLKLRLRPLLCVNRRTLCQRLFESSRVIRDNTNASLSQSAFRKQLFEHHDKYPLFFELLLELLCELTGVTPSIAPKTVTLVKDIDGRLNGFEPTNCSIDRTFHSRKVDP